MSTKAQKTANRENSKKSTGPKTTKGKDVSAQNATKHGFFAQQDVIKYESQVDYDMLKHELIEDLKPIGPMQYILADRIVSLSWRLERTVRMHNQTIDAMLEREDANHDLALGRMANKDFSYDKSLDHLMMYERRMENSLYKTMRELKNIQKEKTQNKPNYQADRKPPGIGPFYSSSRHSATPHGSRATGHESRIKMQNEPNLHSQTNLTPAISKDYGLTQPGELLQKIINQSRPKADYTNHQLKGCSNSYKGM